MRLSGKGKQRGVFTCKGYGRWRGTPPEGVGRSLDGEERIISGGGGGLSWKTRNTRQKGKGKESLLACVGFTFSERKGRERGELAQAFTNTRKDLNGSREGKPSHWCSDFSCGLCVITFFVALWFCSGKSSFLYPIHFFKRNRLRNKKKQTYKCIPM